MPAHAAPADTPHPAALHAALADWYASHARDLPWRRTTDPYAILVSEVMLQQTQVARTIPRYAEFLASFPTIEALAQAPVADVIRAWSGMGFNARAVRLHRLAVEVVALHGGKLPPTAVALRTLPGIGPYTAAAVACFAFGASEPVLDTNVYRVLSRVAHGLTPPSRQELEPLARALLPGPGAPLDPSSWAQALMDVGAALCSVSAPACGDCPLERHCAAAPELARADAPRTLAESSVPYAPKQGAFAGSTRFHRGRIVAALRDLPEGGSLSAQQLADAAGGRSPAEIAALVDGLVRDGLARRVGGGAALP